MEATRPARCCHWHKQRQQTAFWQQGFPSPPPAASAAAGCNYTRPLGGGVLETVDTDDSARMAAEYGVKGAHACSTAACKRAARARGAALPPWLVCRSAAGPPCVRFWAAQQHNAPLACCMTPTHAAPVAACPLWPLCPHAAERLCPSPPSCDVMCCVVSQALHASWD